ncbi:histidinol-phosphate transaminase [bacterium]|nr:histidinol-phosphate transaminase [bacterium]
MEPSVYAELVPHYIANLRIYQSGKSIAEVQRRYGLERVIKLASNENPWGPSPKALLAVRQHLDEVHRYPDQSALDLRSALAQRYQLRNENIIVGNGSEGIMGYIVRAFLHENDEAVTAHGTFTGFPILCHSRGIAPIQVPLRDYCFDLEAISERITPRTKLIYLCNPNNPTGTFFSRRAFDHFMEKVPPRVLVILDEAYFEFAQSLADYPDSMDYRHDNVITLRTFSKAYGLAGFRIGYGFGHPELIASLWKVKLPFEPGSLSQIAGVAALEDDQFLAHTLKQNQQGLDLYTRELTQLGISWIPSATNFIALEAPSGWAAQPLFEAMMRRGVIIRPLEQSGLPGCLRISIGTPEENQACLACLQDVLVQGPKAA